MDVVDDTLDSVHIGARIPKELSDKLKIILTETGMSKTDAIVDALTNFIDNYNALRCPSCGVINDPDAKFCKSCGKGLNPVDTADLENLLARISNDPKQLAFLLKTVLESK